MIQRGHIVQPVDLAISESKGTPTIDIIDGRYRHAEYRGMRDVPRLSDAEIRELQDAHNVNTCDECDEWFGDDNLEAYEDDGLTDMSEEDFFLTLTGNDMAEFSALPGQTFSKVELARNWDVTGNDAILFYQDGILKYALTHTQDCCESVYLSDIEGELSSLENTVILFADESSNSYSNDDCESGTWSFYKLNTRKGWVDMRFNGQSNGYYSETVYLHDIDSEGRITW